MRVPEPLSATELGRRLGLSCTVSPKLTILIALTLAVVLTVAMSAWPGLTGSAESAATDSTATPAQSATTVGERGGPAVAPRVLAALEELNDRLREQEQVTAELRRRPNRVVVQDVMENSPAAIAGLRPGDTLVSAANRRIHSTRDLLQAANSGPVDEALRVRRGNSTLDVYVPRGPLGVRTSRGYENPVDGT